MDKGNLSPSVAGLKYRSVETIDITALRLSTAHSRIINNSPRHAVISSRAITGKYSTDVSVSCLLSPGVEIVEISMRDNIFKRSSLTYVLLQ